MSLSARSAQGLKVPYDELGGVRSMALPPHLSRSVHRRIEVRAIDAALRVLESDDDDRRTRITAPGRQFVLTAAAEAVDAAAERATLWMQLHGYSAAAACVALRPPVRDVEGSCFLCGGDHHELECHTHNGGSAPGASSSSSTQAAVSVAESAVVGCERVSSTQVVVSVVETAAVGREQPHTQERASLTPTLDYLADLGEAAGEDSQILRRLSEAVRRENEGVKVPESDANSMIEPEEEEEPVGVP